MRNKTTLILMMLCIVFGSTSKELKSQEIEATVNLITDGMLNEHLQNIETLSSTLERYINSNQFSNTDWEGPKVQVSISIQLTAAGRNTFNANLFIVSKRGILGQDDASSVAMMFEDKGNWNFEFSNNSSLSYDFMRYDNIASIIDFYMLIIIGLDLDSYGELDGDQSFIRAKNIFNVAVNRSAAGWESYSQDYGRKTLINDLTSPRLDAFRKLMFEYYVDGIDMIAEDRPQALRNLAKVISGMADFKERYLNPIHLMDAFFFTKCQEICELFKGYKENPKVFRDLMFIDPTNTVRYEAARDAR